MKQESLSLLEFQQRFSTEDACVEHLFRLRWPDGYRCPRCGHARYYFHSTRMLDQCSKCKYQVSVTAGTIFHKTRTSLVKWFWTIFMMTRQKSGVSMQGPQRMLGIPSYQTVWTMGHKIRKAMADRAAPYQLAGLVEMDDTYLGPRKPGVRGQAARGKAKIVIGVESHEDHPGFAVMKHVPSANPEQVLGTCQDKVAPQTTLRTDGWFAYSALASHGYIHEPHVINKDKESLKKLRWVHVLAANLKGNIRGVYHGVSQKHLDRYLAEFSYRFNRRYWDPQLFNRAVVACVSTSTVTFVELSG